MGLCSKIFTRVDSHVKDVFRKCLGQRQGNQSRHDQPRLMTEVLPEETYSVLDREPGPDDIGGSKMHASSVNGDDVCTFEDLESQFSKSPTRLEPESFKTNRRSGISKRCNGTQERTGIESGVWTENPYREPDRVDTPLLHGRDPEETQLRHVAQNHKARGESVRTRSCMRPVGSSCLQEIMRPRRSQLLNAEPSVTRLRSGYWIYGTDSDRYAGRKGPLVAHLFLDDDVVTTSAVLATVIPLTAFVTVISDAQ